MLYPIRGLYKIPLLILEWVIFLVFIEISAIFWIRMRSSKTEVNEPREKAFMWLSLGYALMWAFTIIGDFYILNRSLRFIFRNFGFISIALGGFLFTYIMEKYILIFYKKFFLTFIYGTLLGVLILVFLPFPVIIPFYMIAFIPFFIIFSAFYFKKLWAIYVKKELTEYWRPLFFFMTGCLLLFIGYGLTTEISMIVFGSNLLLRLIGDIFQISATGFLLLFLVTTPSLAEFDWQGKIDAILLMHESGRFVFSRFIKEQADRIDGSLYSGYLTSVKLILEKVMDHDKLSVIEKKDKFILYEPGDNLVGVLICDERLSSLEILLKKFVKKVELVYGSILKDWNGSLKILKPIEDIADKIFS